MTDYVPKIFTKWELEFSGLRGSLRGIEKVSNISYFIRLIGKSSERYWLRHLAIHLEFSKAATAMFSVLVNNGPFQFAKKIILDQ